MRNLRKRSIALVMSVLTSLMLVTSLSAGAFVKVAKSSDPVTITFYTWEKTGYTAQQDNIVKVFEAQNPGIKVKFVYPTDNNGGDYLTKMNTILMSSNNDVDIFGASGASGVANFIKAGLMEPLDSYIKSEKLNFDKEYNYHFIVDGKTYVIPTFETTWFVMLNKDLLKKARLPLPSANWTWDDYKRYAKKMTSGTGNNKIYGSYMHTWNNYYSMGIYANSSTPQFYDKNGKLLVDQPMFKDFLSLRNQMENVDKSEVPLADVKAMNLAYRNQFFSGKIGMLATGAWMISEIKNVASYPHTFQTAFAPLPRFGNSPEGKTFGDSHYFGVSKNSTHKAEAYKFLRFYSENRSKIGPLTGFTGLKNQDRIQVAKTLIGSKYNLYDLPSLVKVYYNNKFSINYLKNSKDLNPNETQITNMVISESEKYLMGAQSLDQSIQNMLNLYKNINQQ